MASRLRAKPADSSVRISGYIAPAEGCGHPPDG
jgi:hypothetical protein